MKKYLKLFFPVIVSATLMIGAPFIKEPCECGLTLPVVFAGAILGCGGEKESSSSSDQNMSGATILSDNQVKTVQENSSNSELKVTFVELGSVNCIPCKMMKPVMEKIEKLYPGQVKVIFHDVWTPEGRASGVKFGIRAIPTQVFLDKDNKEYYRHEGFFPFEEVNKILKQKGVN